jgi:hypothetical protein
MVMALGAGAACAGRRAAAPEPSQAQCVFLVDNHTSEALEIRLVRSMSTTPIGALNPGEGLTHSVPCAQHSVWIAGVPIPAQVGAPTFFGVVEGSASLVEGDRVRIALYWP